MVVVILLWIYPQTIKFKNRSCYMHFIPKFNRWVVFAWIGYQTYVESYCITKWTIYWNSNMNYYFFIWQKNLVVCFSATVWKIIPSTINWIWCKKNLPNSSTRINSKYKNISYIDLSVTLILHKKTLQYDN